MTQAIDTVFIDAILVRLLRELGLPETLPLVKLSPRMQDWIVAEAEVLRKNAMGYGSFAVMVRYRCPLTRENYLDFNGVEEKDMDSELEGELPDIFQESAIESRVSEVMFAIEIDNVLRQLEGR
jgi:hypothetical protein